MNQDQELANLRKAVREMRDGLIYAAQLWSDVPGSPDEKSFDYELAAADAALEGRPVPDREGWRTNVLPFRTRALTDDS
jgi:hypothetical protein